MLRKGESFRETKTSKGTYWQTLVKDLMGNLIFSVMSHDLECYSFCMSSSTVVNRSASDAMPVLSRAQKGVDVICLYCMSFENTGPEPKINLALIL